jgi:hypothetical protein
VAISGPAIEWTWNAQDNALNQEFRFREVGATEWQPTVSITDSATDIITSGLVDGAMYEAELRNVTAARRPSARISSGTVQAVANATPPDPVEDLTATPDTDSIEISWVTANDPNHAATRIYRAVGAGSVFGDATLFATVFGPPNTAQTIVNTSLSPETYVYWAASINASGIEGALVGPVDAEIT